MRILITGGFGFIGGRLGKNLDDAGHQVVLGARKLQESPTWLPNADVEVTSWTDSRLLGKACAGIDVIIHAAGMNAQDCTADPIAALESNGIATARLVKAAIDAGVQRIIYLSTAHVYASPLIGTITEDSCPRSLHSYATSHLVGEYAVLGADQRGQIDGMVLRLSNVFGAPMHRGVNCWMLLVNDLCRQAVQERQLVLRSNPSQQRDFVTMTEVCGFISSLTERGAHSNFPRVINVGSGQSAQLVTMASLVQSRCEALFNYKPVIRALTSEKADSQVPLVYKTDRLRGTGLGIPIAPSVEIDALLQFCREAFS